MPSEDIHENQVNLEESFKPERVSDSEVVILPVRVLEVISIQAANLLKNTQQGTHGACVAKKVY